MLSYGRAWVDLSHAGELHLINLSWFPQLPSSFFSPDQLPTHIVLSFYLWLWCSAISWKISSLGGCKVPGYTTRKCREVSFPSDESWPLGSRRWERAEQIQPVPFLPFADLLLAVVFPLAPLEKTVCQANKPQHPAVDDWDKWPPWKCTTLLCIFPHLLSLSFFFFPHPHLCRVLPPK